MTVTRLDRKFIFIGGLHRSGTTLLADLLRSHPDFSGFQDTGAPMDEGQHLQSVYPSSKGWGRDAVGRFGFDPFAYLNERSKRAAPEMADRLFSEWSRHWDINAPYLVEKSPPNIIRMRYLQACFPDCYCIVITRHPIANALATKKWCGRNPIAGIMANWAICHRAFMRDRPKLKRSMVVRYEDLVSDPKQSLTQIAEFLGAAPYFEASGEVRKGVNERYFVHYRDVLANPFDKTLLTMARPVLEPTFKRFGYSFDDAQS